MKKALLTLTMICAMPISSLNAGWFSNSEAESDSTPQAQAQAYVDSAKKWGFAAVASPVIGLVCAVATLPAESGGDYTRGLNVTFMAILNTYRFIVPSLVGGLLFAGKACYNVVQANRILKEDKS